MTKWERAKKKWWLHLIPAKTRFYLKLSGACDILLLQSLTAGPISSAASPSPGRIPFDQAWSSAECGFHLLAPTVLKPVGGYLSSHSATTRGNEGSFVGWHLIWSGSVQWSPQISPGPGWVCAYVCLPAAPQPPTVEETVKILWSNIKAIRCRVKMCFFFFLYFFFFSPLWGICLWLVRYLTIQGQKIRMQSRYWSYIKLKNSNISGFAIWDFLKRDSWFTV